MLPAMRIHDIGRAFGCKLKLHFKSYKVAVPVQPSCNFQPSSKNSQPSYFVVLYGLIIELSFPDVCSYANSS